MRMRCLCLSIALVLAGAAQLAVADEAEMTATSTGAEPETPDGGKPWRKAERLEKVEVSAVRENDYAASSSNLATKTDTPLIDIPQSISVITQQVIKDQAMQGMADVVRYVPGVGMAQGEGNRDTPVFRGNSTTADMFIDGLRDDVQYFRDLYNIERVEALKGPNAMIFGRGGSGGLLNRVSKVADGVAHRDVGVQLGSWDKRRISADVGDAVNNDVSVRVNAMAEDSGSYRDGVDYERRGINPTLTWLAGEATAVTLGVEHFEDERTADRGVSSFHGKPLDVDPSTFIGDPARSNVSADVDAFNALIEHDFDNGANLRNRTRWARYDKFYQNIFAGAVSAAGDTVRIQAYNNATDRTNLFNQTDITWHAQTGTVEHTLLAGAEFGRQVTDNVRNTGFFTDAGATATAIDVPLAQPIYTGPVEFRPGATDADNHGVAKTAAAYVQDQIEFSPQWQAVLGLRYDHLKTDLHNNRNDSDLDATDGLVSPRVGLIYKPQENLSFYLSDSVAFLPRSGEQLSSLSLSNAALDPEKFRNREVGVKWDIGHDLAFTAAVYRLDRSNVAVVDPADSTKLILLSGNSQRMRGVEIGLAGNITEQWQLMGGYAWQDGDITRDIKTSATGTAIPKGTTLAQVPRQSFSLWNRYDFDARWGAGLGLIRRGEVFASTSNAVTLPAYARVDAAVFCSVSDSVKLQLNVENLTDREYFVSANSDTNITPGSPRAFTLGLDWKF